MCGLRGRRGLGLVLLSLPLLACGPARFAPALKTLPTLGTATPAATGAPRGGPAISIIIDDLGDRGAAGRRALALPGAVAYAFLPGTPFAARQARQAHARGREVLLHLPLEPIATAQAVRTALTRKSSAADLQAGLVTGLAAVPHARGVNNHQGSLLTQSAAHMDWLMQALRARGGLYFIDSRTSPRSLAYAAARQHGLPASGRDVFLDDPPEPAAVAAQWAQLLRLARRRGTALAIGHPHDSTLSLLERELPRLAQQGVRLVPPSELIRLQQRDTLAPPQLQLSAGLRAAP